MNANTNKIEIGLIEEVFPDRQNTDEPMKLKSTQDAPFFLSVGILRGIESSGGDLIVMDLDSVEIQCIDQVLHLLVDKEQRVRGFE